jgi:molybdopterin-guanine dinucleotide biosynthesis protein A
MRFSAVILVGGRSTRMGRDKAFLEIGGQTLLAGKIALAQDAGAAELFISGRAGTDYSAFGLPVLRDKFADAGPLAGIHAALLVTSHPLVLVLAVDLATLTSPLVKIIVGEAHSGMGVIPRCHGEIEPLAAIYPKTATKICEQQLIAGCNSVKDFGSKCVAAGLAAFLNLPEENSLNFKNLNRPDDLNTGMEPLE